MQIEKISYYLCFTTNNSVIERNNVVRIVNISAAIDSDILNESLDGGSCLNDYSLVSN